MKKRLFASLLCLALCLSLLPITALADGDGGVEYIERGWDGNAVTEQVKTIDTYTTITSNTIQWNNGWYVAQGEVTIGTDDNPQRVTVTGDVHLILTDGCTLTAGRNSGSITCTNTLKNDRWLNGFSDVIANIFGIRH